MWVRAGRTGYVRRFVCARKMIGLARSSLEPRTGPVDNVRTVRSVLFALVLVAIRWHHRRSVTNTLVSCKTILETKAFEPKDAKRKSDRTERPHEAKVRKKLNRKSKQLVNISYKLSCAEFQGLSTLRSARPPPLTASKRLGKDGDWRVTDSDAGRARVRAGARLRRRRMSAEERRLVGGSLRRQQR